jgi:hypothetical protein
VGRKAKVLKGGESENEESQENRRVRKREEEEKEKGRKIRQNRGRENIIRAGY